MPDLRLRNTDLPTWCDRPMGEERVCRPCMDDFGASAEEATFLWRSGMPEDVCAGDHRRVEPDAPRPEAGPVAVQSPPAPDLSHMSRAQRYRARRALAAGRPIGVRGRPRPVQQ